MKKLMFYCMLVTTACINAMDERIEPLNLATHGLEVRAIFTKAFPDMRLSAMLEAGNTPQGSVIIADNAVKGFMVTNDTKPSFFTRWIFGIFDAKEHDTRTIEWLAVDPSAQNNHYGSKLWNHMELDARNKGIKQIILVPTTRAINFYHRHDVRCIETSYDACAMMKKSFNDIANATARPATRDADDKLLVLFSA
jgi:ribosomal protein S18 acetylase RimI-like enzyme